MSQQPAHILIADDEEDWRERIAVPFQKAGYRIDFASDYKETLKKLRTQKFDVACMNILLRGEIKPGWKLDWTNLLGEASDRKISVIIITAMNQAVSLKDIYDEVLRYGVKDIFFKDDITRSKLVERIKEILCESEKVNKSLDGVPPTFDVFFAYNSKDKPQVETIARELKQRGLHPWLDIEQIPPGRWFQDIIQQAISTIKSAAIFIGPGGLGKWQVVELRSFISRCVEAGIPVMPVLLPGMDDIPDHLLFLQELNWVQFHSLDDEDALDNLEWGITGKHPKRL